MGGRYGEGVLTRFYNPRHAGRMASPSAVGFVGNPACGDTAVIFIRVLDDHIREISFLAQGCPALIACCEALCELAEGRHLDEAAEITDEVVVDALGGLPPEKVHCSAIAAVALRDAIWRYVFKVVEEV